MAAPDNFVLKAYITESDAKADTNALQVESGTAFLLNDEQAANYNFFAHTKYFFRIESNEPVIEFYIDWDDGIDNDPEGNANYTLIKFDNPQFVGITSHIFTRDKFHFPKIRVKSVDGYLSKFYQPLGDNDFKGIDVLQGEATLAEDRNSTYRIESDSTGTSHERIPVFAPTPKPPIGILKADKNRVFAGLNTAPILDVDGGNAYTSQTIKLRASQALEAARSAVKVRVTYYTEGERDGSQDLSSTPTTGDRGDIRYSDLTLGGTSTIANVLHVLRVELLDQREASAVDTATLLGAGEKLWITNNAAVAEAYPVIAEVSLGNPVVEFDDPRTTVTLDATESIVRNPDQSISKYYINDGDSVHQTALAGSAAVTDVVSTTNVSNELSSGIRNVFEVADGVKRTSYTFPLYGMVDDDNRWLPRQILARTQVEVGNSAIYHASDANTDAKATYNKSFIHHWVDEGQSDDYSHSRDGIAGYSWPSDMISSNFFVFRGLNDPDDWTNIGVDSSQLALPTAKSANPAGRILFTNHGISSDRRIGATTTDDIDDADSINNGVMASRHKFNRLYWDCGEPFENAAADATTFIRKPDVGDRDTNTTLDTLHKNNGTQHTGTPKIRVGLLYTASLTSGSTNRSITFTDLDVSSGTATVTAASHGLSVGDEVFIQGSNTQSYDESVVVRTVADANTFTYSTGLGNFSNITGTIKGCAQWKPLKFVNKTLADIKNLDTTDVGSFTTWYTPGTWEWEEPDDWVSVDPAQIPDRFWPHGEFEEEHDTLAGRVTSFTADGGETTQVFDETVRWDEQYNKYGLLMTIDTDAGTGGSSWAGYDDLSINSVHICSGPENQIIDLIDPMHVSLNPRAITQSVSYNHKGKYQIVEDRIGRAEIRKIGSTGGTLTFGGVDIRDTDGTYTRDKFNQYQRAATPVYLDVDHKSGITSRFFGVVTDMSEDHPVGMQFAKYGLTMQVSHMIQYNNTGSTIDGVEAGRMFTKNYVSLGGDMIDEPRYI